MAKKTHRGDHEAHIRRRADGRWEAQIRHEGQRTSLYARTKSEVLAKLRDLKEPGPASKQVLASYLSEWLTTRKSNVAWKTWEAYESVIRLHITPYLGDKDVARIKSHDVEALLAHMRQQDVGARTVQYAFDTLRKCLNDAIKAGLITTNVCVAVERPKVHGRPRQIPDLAATLRVLDGIFDPRLRLASAIAVFGGLRRGEICGLRWENVDLDRGVLHVAEQLQSGEAGLQVTPTKTTGSRRAVAIPRVLRDALRELQREDGDGYVLAWPDGRPLRPDWLSKAFHSAIREVDGTPNIRFHDLRHAHASLLLLGGVHPKVVSSRLGHSAIGITLDLYSHLIDGIDRQAAETIDVLLQEAVNRGGQDTKS